MYLSMYVVFKIDEYWYVDPKSVYFSESVTIINY